MAYGHDETIDILRSVPHPHSLGWFYAGVTFWLSWGHGEEGKTMALAAYGRPIYAERLREKYFDLKEDGSFRFRLPELPFEFFPKEFGPARPPAQPPTQYHMDVAASAQLVLEETMLASARHVKKLTDSRNLVLTGGVALNSVANGKIMKARLFDQIVALPHANDAGTALGGALHVHYNVLGNKRRGNKRTMSHAYWGRPVDIEAVEEEARRRNLAFSCPPSITAAAAELLAAGKIVGWIQGRAEIGPRALGNRSILADPRRAEMKDIINAKVKDREGWRPFAPSVLADEASIYFDTDQSLPYMIIVADVRPQWRDKIPAVLHVDGTARVQTVERELNPRFHELLTLFKEKSGIGMVLNTSFNGRGEPIVQTCGQAMDLFLNTQMDALAVGDYLFTAKPVDWLPRPFAPINENVSRLAGYNSVLLASEWGVAGYVTACLNACLRLGKTVTLLVPDVAAAVRELEPPPPVAATPPDPLPAAPAAGGPVMALRSFYRTYLRQLPFAQQTASLFVGFIRAVRRIAKRLPQSPAAAPSQTPPVSPEPVIAQAPRASAIPDSEQPAQICRLAEGSIVVAPFAAYEEHVRRSYDVVVFAVPLRGFDVLFDPALVNHKTYAMTSNLRSTAPAPVFWLDTLGGLTDPQYPLLAIERLEGELPDLRRNFDATSKDASFDHLTQV